LSRKSGGRAKKSGGRAKKGGGRAKKERWSRKKRAVAAQGRWMYCRVEGAFFSTFLNDNVI
jgi:hypothetical protein